MSDSLDGRRLEARSAHERIRNAQIAVDAATQAVIKAQAEVCPKLHELGIDHAIDDDEDGRTVAGPIIRRAGRTVIFKSDPLYRPLAEAEKSQTEAFAELQAALRARLPAGWQGDVDAPDFISLADVESWLARILAGIRDLTTGHRPTEDAATRVAARDIDNFYRVLDHLGIPDGPKWEGPPADVRQAEVAVRELLAWVRRRLPPAPEIDSMIAEFEKELEGWRESPAIMEEGEAKRFRSAVEAQGMLERNAEERYRRALLAAGFTDAEIGDGNHARSVRGDDPRKPAYHKANLEYDRRIKAIGPWLKKRYAPPTTEATDQTPQATGASEQGEGADGKCRSKRKRRQRGRRRGDYDESLHQKLYASYVTMAHGKKGAAALADVYEAVASRNGVPIEEARLIVKRHRAREQRKAAKQSRRRNKPK